MAWKPGRARRFAHPPIMNDVVIGLLAALAGLVVGYAVRTMIGRVQVDSAEKQARSRLGEADKEAASRLKEAEIQARAEVVKAREEFERSTKTRRKELQDTDERLAQREENLDRKLAVLEKKEQTVNQRQEEVQSRAEDLARRRQELDRLTADAQARLQRLAGMTGDEARRDLFQRMEAEVRAETGGLARRLVEEARESAEREACKIVAQSIQRYSASHAAEMMTSTVPLPSDDIKGRIIGREGRNIRALEAATGVSMLVDDTPEAVVISCFDPVRREVARQALEMLVADGRIHPARIEEVVAKVQANLEETIRQAGEAALYEAQVQGVDPELVRKVGRLKFRTSYSQNVLRHSLEVAHLMGVMAGELGLDPAVARRIGMLHDIGKSMDHEVEGGHSAIGAELLKRLNEPDAVVNAVAAHHEDVEARSVYAILCSAADAISGSRPGARSETSGVYVQRLEKLEAIANGYPGVRKSYAMQAGREIRVVVDPQAMDDNEAMILAREVSRRIAAELQFPGQIRVVVIREQRFVEYAR
jgi:ribonuclease Y